MRNKKWAIPLIIAACLIACALCLIAVYATQLDAQSQISRQAADKLAGMLPEVRSGSAEEYADIKMPTLEVDGVDYVCVVDIPSAGISVAVKDDWSDALVRTPARFGGSAYDASLVIGGADHPLQFSFCDKVEHGTSIFVTDMTGARFGYEVCEINRTAHADSAWLTGKDCALTIFCLDTHTMEYIAVRCDAA